MSSTRYQPGILARDPQRRRQLVNIFMAGLDAVDPREAVSDAFRRVGDTLRFGGQRFDLARFDRGVVIAFGKASVPMARAALNRLSGLRQVGVVVSNDPEAVDPLEVFRAGHPIPDGDNLIAARRVVEFAQQTGPGDLVVVLISGGGSALLTLPARDLTLDDIAETTATLLSSGVTIHELNTVRKHLSAVNGGRLGEMLAGAGALLTPVVSDVVGDDLSVIASGPTVPDPTTYADALAVVTRFASGIPNAVIEHLERGATGEIAETPKEAPSNQTVELVASARRAAEGAEQEALRLGWTASIETIRLTGEARDVGAQLARDAMEMSPGQLRIYAGETTVTVKGNGKGGRNQELALAAAVELQDDSGFMLLSGGTDGVDGMSSDAGALIDGGTVAAGRAVGLDALDHLERNDSNTYLQGVGDVLTTGPTGTNVGDLILVARSG